MKVYFIGDTHFGHTNILKFEPRYRFFDSIEEHDEQLVLNWNSVVRQDDIVWHLGDVFFGQDTQAMKHLQRLNGHKNLVLGNHDKPKHMEFYHRYFEKVYGVAYYKDGILSHIPVHASQLDHRFKFNIHGHMHGHKLDDSRYTNVSCEQVDMTPICWDELKKTLPLDK